jgi:uncharacterized protein (TIGR03067 family)
MDRTMLRPIDLIGAYTIVAGEKDGQPEPPERLQGSTVKFTETTVSVTDQDKKETWIAAYELDPKQSPCAITMREAQGAHKGEIARGLIEKQDHQLRLIYALPGGSTPTGFQTRDKQLSFVMTPLHKGAGSEHEPETSAKHVPR